MADTTHKLVDQNYTTPDLVAKVTGKAKYSEDYFAEGMLYARLLTSPYPHARVRSINASAALAMPGPLPALTAHTNEHEWHLGHALAQEGTFNAIDAAAGFAAGRGAGSPPPAS